METKKFEAPHLYTVREAAKLDALNGVAYRDDSQVVEVRVVKHDRTRKQGDSIRFEVEPIPENELV